MSEPVRYIGNSDNKKQMSLQDKVNYLCQFRSVSDGDDDNWYFYQAILYSLDNGLPVEYEKKGDKIVIGITDEAKNKIDKAEGFAIFDRHIQRVFDGQNWVLSVDLRPEHRLHINSIRVSDVLESAGDDYLQVFSDYIESEAEKYKKENKIKGAEHWFDIVLLDCELVDYPYMCDFEEHEKLLNTYCEAVKRYGIDAYIEIGFE